MLKCFMYTKVAFPYLSHWAKVEYTLDGSSVHRKLMLYTNCFFSLKHQAFPNLYCREILFFQIKLS